MALLERRLSELEGQDLLNNRLEAWREDFEWREQWIKPERVLDLYESDTEDPTDEDGLPRVNLVQRAIDDNIAFVLPNIPRARLVADRDIPSGLDPLAKELHLANIEETEDTINALVETKLSDSQYDDIVELAVRDAGILGYGCLFTFIDRSMDLRESYELRDLLLKLQNGEPWSRDDAMRYTMLSKKCKVEYIEGKNLFLQAGVQRADKTMLRQSYVEYFNTLALRERYKHVEGADRIQPGRATGYYVEADEQAKHLITGRLTTYEVEPFLDEYKIPGTNQTAKFLNARMIKTVIAGGILVEHESWTSTEGPVRLPGIMFYFQESKRHPYGISQAKKLAQSERFINRVRVLMYKSGLNGVRPNGVSIFLRHLQPEDREELKESMETGKPAFITGAMAGNEVFDIRQVVMPHSYAASALDPSLRQMYQYEMEAFQSQSRTVDLEAVRDARSGSAKRAQITVDDRPKTLSVLSLSRSVEDLYDNLFEIVRVLYPDTNSPAKIDTQGGRQQVMLNEPYSPNLPVLNGDGDPVYSPAMTTPQNPAGLVMRPIDLVLNSTRINMKAEAETRASLPFDMIARYQIMRAFMADGLIIDETMRRYVLDRELRTTDDINRNRQARQQQQAMQQAMSAMQQSGMQIPSLPGGAGLGSPQDVANGNLAQDLAADVAPNPPVIQ